MSEKKEDVLPACKTLYIARYDKGEIRAANLASALTIKKLLCPPPTTSKLTK